MTTSRRRSIFVVLRSGCLNFVRGYFDVNARLAAHHAWGFVANCAFVLRSVNWAFQAA